MVDTEDRTDPTEVKNQVMYYLPFWTREWLRDEAKRRGISASALIVSLVRKEQGDESEAAA